MTTGTIGRVDEDRLHEFMHRAVGDMGAAMSAALVLAGDRLGLYQAMAGAGPLTPAELAEKTDTRERYVREWLLNQAASGYVQYDRATGRFELPAEQATALADESSPFFIPGAFQIIASMFKDEPKITRAFRTGEGVAWGEHCPCLFKGTERFFRPNYRGNLVSNWIPAIEGIEAKLRAGGRVADVGCGHGASTILMAEAFPKSTFVGFDNHPASVDAANERAREAGVADRVRFEVAAGEDFEGEFDFVACFDCLHDMGDPVGCAANVRRRLADDGAWMIVEPFANDEPEENFNPVGRVYYAASTMICVPASLASDGPALGAQAGERRLSEVVRQGGFSSVRRAAETPFNLVLEARP